MTVRVSAGLVVVLQGGTEIARHDQRLGRRETALRPEHLSGIVGTAGRSAVAAAWPSLAPPAPELLRPLADYEQAVGGGW